MRLYIYSKPRCDVIPTFSQVNILFSALKRLMARAVDSRNLVVGITILFSMNLVVSFQTLPLTYLQKNPPLLSYGPQSTALPMSNWNQLSNIRLPGTFEHKLLDGMNKFAASMITWKHECSLFPWEGVMRAGKGEPCGKFGQRGSGGMKRCPLALVKPEITLVPKTLDSFVVVFQPWLQFVWFGTLVTFEGPFFTMYTFLV